MELRLHQGDGLPFTEQWQHPDVHSMVDNCIHDEPAIWGPRIWGSGRIAAIVLRLGNHLLAFCKGLLPI
jgi:hypothetical protein